VGVERRSPSCRSNDQPWRAWPHQKNKGLWLCFRQTQATSSPRRSARDECVSRRRRRCGPANPTTPLTEPGPVHGGPRPPPRRRERSVDVLRPPLDSAPAVATRPDVSLAGARGQAKPHTPPAEGARATRPPITASRCRFGWCGCNTIARNSPERRGSPPTRSRRGRKGCRRVTRRSRLLRSRMAGR